MVTSARLLARGTLRRVMHDRGSTASISQRPHTSVGRTCPVRSAGAERSEQAETA